MKTAITIHKSKLQPKPKQLKEVLILDNAKIHNIPKEIKDQNKWLFGDVNTKSPVDINGYNVNWTDSRYYKSFVSVTTNNPKNLYYSYLLDNDYIVIDLDKCFDDNKKLYPWAKEILNNLDIEENRPYIEYSISGYGLHIIYKVTKTLSKYNNKSIKLNKIHSKYSHLPDKCGIEVFIKKHCMILTGNVYQDYKIEKVPSATRKVNELHKKVELLTKIDNNKIKNKYNRNKEMNKEDLNNIFDYVKSSIDIVDVLNKYEIEYNNKLINCPLPNHEDKTPSMAIYEVTNSFNCFGCKQGGTIIDFVALMEDITPFKAVVKLNDMFNHLKIDFEEQNKTLNKEWFTLDDKNKYHLDATKLRNHLIEEHHIINTEQNMYMYMHGTYEIIEKSELTKLIENHMIDNENNKFKSTHYVEEVYKQTQRHFLKFENFNKLDSQINLKNCILNVKYGSSEFTKEEHSPDNLTTFQLKYNYNPDATCQNFDKFINDTLSKDQQLLLQEIMGYSLILNNRAKKFFGFYGRGDTGKSVVLRILSNIIGENNTSGVPLQDLTKKNSRFDTASLLSKSINICGDIPATPLEDTGVIKMLTGDDLMKSEKKGRDSVFIYNTARMYFSMNQLPSSYDKSPEFFNRFIIIPFNNVVPKEKQDKDLLKKFNYEGILNWMIKGLLRLMENNLNFGTTKENEEIISQYIKQDSPVVDFVDEYCEFNKKSSITTSDLLNYFKIYCNNENLRFKKTGTQLRNEIATKFKDVKESKRIINPKTKKPTARGLIGISIKQDILAEYQDNIYI